MILPQVRDPRFITIRRGGTLTDSDHQLLALWAAACAEHVLHLFETVEPSDPRPRRAIEQARAWVRGEVKMMQARAAGGAANSAARPLTGAARFAAYAAGQAAVVAHVAAHELGAAAYAIKAARAALIAYAAAPSSCAATCATTAAWPAAYAANRAAPVSGLAAELAAPPAARACIIFTSPRTQARACSIARRGRGSEGSTVSKRCSTCSAHAAAHNARSWWSESVSVPPRRMVMNRGSRTWGRIMFARVLVRPA